MSGTARARGMPVGNAEFNGTSSPWKLSNGQLRQCLEERRVVSTVIRAHVLTEELHGPESKFKRHQDEMVQGDVPLKGGRVLPTKVMNPFLSSSPAETKKVEANILGAMNSAQIDVAVKRGNAQAFFRFIRKKEKREELFKSIRQDRAQS